MVLEGRTLKDHGPDDAIAAGIYLVPEDRQGCGLILDFPIAENISLADLGAVSDRGFVDRRRERAHAERQRDRLGIKAHDVTRATAELSGGNQQKVVLAKWLAMRAAGADLRRADPRHRRRRQGEIYRADATHLADAGVAILMISSDMEEVIGVSRPHRRHVTTAAFPVSSSAANFRNTAC